MEAIFEENITLLDSNQNKVLGTKVIKVTGADHYYSDVTHYDFVKDEIIKFLIMKNK